MPSSSDLQKSQSWQSHRLQWWTWGEHQFAHTLNN